MTSFTLQAAATPSTIPAVVLSFMLQVAVAAATTSTALAAATSFTLSVSNFYEEGLLEAKHKCGVAKIYWKRLRAKQLKQRWEITSQKRDRGHSVLQPQSLVLSRHKRIKRREET